MVASKQNPRCKMEGCESKHLSRGFCEKHYRQFSRGTLSEEGTYLREVRERGEQDGKCIVEGCSSTSLAAFNMCKTHWQQVKRGQRDKDGTLLVELKIIDPERKCKVEGCEEPYKARGYCKKHRHLAKERIRLSVTLSESRVQDGDGYILVNVKKEYPQIFETPWGRKKYYSRASGWYQEHRLVMELHLERALASTEIVHHKNGVRDDNRIGNLELLHVKKHASGHSIDVDGSLEFLEQHVHTGMPGISGIRERLLKILERVSE